MSGAGDVTSASSSGRRVASVTIASVALAAGVSTATVSRVMSGGAGVSPELTQRVRSSARSLGYRPSALAQALARGRSGTVGVVVPDLANPYFQGVMSGFAAAAAATGHRMLVATSTEEATLEHTLADDLLRQVDGLLLCSPRMPRADLQRVLSAGRPVVVANRQLPGLAVPTVGVDSYAGALEMAGHLLRLGHREITYLAGPELSWSDAERRRALRHAESFGLRTIDVACGATMEDGYRAVDVAMESAPTPPSALLAFNDIVAFGALARLRELGIPVPEAMSVAGFDDIAFSAYAAPALTTVRNATEEVGRQAWAALAQVIAGESDVQPQLLTPTLVERASTAAVSASPPQISPRKDHR